MLNSALGNAELHRWGIGQLEADLLSTKGLRLIADEVVLPIFSSGVRSRHIMRMDFETTPEFYRCVEDKGETAGVDCRDRFGDLVEGWE